MLRTEGHINPFDNEKGYEDLYSDTQFQSRREKDQIPPSSPAYTKRCRRKTEKDFLTSFSKLPGRNHYTYDVWYTYIL